MLNCGLCKTEVWDWDTHIAGEEHQANLRDTERLLDSVDGNEKVLSLILPDIRKQLVWPYHN